MASGDEMEARVRALEDWRHAQDIATAVQAEQAKHIDTRFDTLNDKVDKGFDKMFGYVSRVVWLIISALVLGGMGFVLSGGFA